MCTDALLWFVLFSRYHCYHYEEIKMIQCVNIFSWHFVGHHFIYVYTGIKTTSCSKVMMHWQNKQKLFSQVIIWCMITMLLLLLLLMMISIVAERGQLIYTQHPDNPSLKHLLPQIHTLRECRGFDFRHQCFLAGWSSLLFLIHICFSDVSYWLPRLQRDRTTLHIISNVFFSTECSEEK